MNSCQQWRTDLSIESLCKNAGENPKFYMPLQQVPFLVVFTQF